VRPGGIILTQVAYSSIK